MTAHSTAMIVNSRRRLGIVLESRPTSSQLAASHANFGIKSNGKLAKKLIFVRFLGLPVLAIKAWSPPHQSHAVGRGGRDRIRSCFEAAAVYGWRAPAPG